MKLSAVPAWYSRCFVCVYYPSFEKEAEPLLNEYGCLHFKFSILLGISRPTYSKEQLEQMKAEDKQTFEFEGKEYTRYEASQLQRKIETAVRHEKDLANMAKASGDDDLRREAQYKINLLTSKYAQLSKASGLPTKMERMQVGGFRRVKTKNELTQTQNHAIIKEKLRKGEIKIEINHEKQLRHIRESKEYIQGKSYLLISEEEAQKLILSKALTGVVHISNGGKQVKEVADFGKIIGVDISRKTGAETKTTKGTIHYSKTGTHLVPTRSDN